MYDCLFLDLHVRVPFDDFIKGVLQILNVAPTQLHMNRWTIMKAFQALCLYISVPATLGLFLHYFRSRPQDKAQWISLIWLPKRPLFHPFTSSYKKFKIDYFKVTIRLLSEKDHFYDLVGNHLFPFYWQQCPQRYDKYPNEHLSVDESRDLEFLESLPRQLPVCRLMALLQSLNLVWDVEGQFCFLFDCF